MCLRLPDNKRIRILEHINNISNKTSIIIRDFAKLLGVLCSACPAIAYEWVYTKRMEREKFLALKKSDGNYENLMVILFHQAITFAREAML